MEIDLEKLQQAGILAFVDLALAKFILKEAYQPTSPQAFFVCHLSQAVRAGHLCIRLVEVLEPRVEDLWRGEDPLDPSDTAQIGEMILAGARSFADMNYPLGIYRDGDRFYFQRYWAQESRFLDLYCALCQTVPAPSIELASNAFDPTLLPEQRLAISQACQSPITLLSGGPGTGKTYTAAYLIRTLWQALPNARQASFQIALAAPTGKAAANLQMNLHKVLKDIPHFRAVQAGTLHALLGLRKNQVYTPRQLHHDLILIDESSMLDIYMWIALLDSLKPGARLVCLGDADQLPSIDTGALFADLTEQFAGTPQVVRLKTCMRTDQFQMLAFAGAVLRGEAEEAWSFLDKGSVRRLLNDQDKPSPEQIVGQARPHFIPPRSLNPESLLQFFKKFRMLSPLRQGPYGSEQLNALLAEQLPTHAVPILITQNDPKLHLFNGEMGIIIQEGTDNTAYFEGAEEIRQFSPILLPPYELAYCLSIHKSQGSEFEHVLLVLPEGGELFGREGLYTAATRAKKQFDLICTQDTFFKAVQKKARRLSGISERISTKISR